MIWVHQALEHPAIPPIRVLTSPILPNLAGSCHITSPFSVAMPSATRMLPSSTGERAKVTWGGMKEVGAGGRMGSLRVRVSGTVKRYAEMKEEDMCVARGGAPRALEALPDTDWMG